MKLQPLSFIKISLVFSMLIALSAARANDAASPTLLGSWHYQGAAIIRSEEGGDALKRILSAKETAPVRDLVIAKLAGAPDQLFYGLGAQALDTRVKLLSPIISDMIEHVSYGEIHATAASSINVSLAIKLPADRQSNWNINLRRYVASLGWELSPPLSQGLTSEWDATSQNSGFLMRYIKKDDWLLISVGSDALTQILEWSRDFNNGAVFHSLQTTDSWWSLHAKLDTLSQLFGGNTQKSLKSITLKSIGDGEYLRSGGHIQFSQAMDDSISDWMIPTNRIQEPVVSFSAQRNLQPLLTQIPGMRKLFPQGVPKQSVAWSRPSRVQNTRAAQDAAPMYLTYATWPVGGNGNAKSVQSIQGGLADVLGTNLLNSGRMLLSSNQLLNALSLKIRPAFIQPFVQGIEYAGENYHMAGLTYMILNRTNPPPPSLFGQITKHPRLRYYHWERSDEKLFQYRNLINLVGFLFGKGQLLQDSPLFAWTQFLEEQLGNTVTQLLRKEDDILEIQRKSQLGLNAFEIALLARWIHSESFPWIDLEEITHWEFPATPKPALK
ncbi:hypothetical protein OAH23_16015 [Verrucomicrobia bacterium]|nr:hypothetical protein [Verrucomicrobiota bacterium]